MKSECSEKTKLLSNPVSEIKIRENDSHCRSIVLKTMDPQWKTFTQIYSTGVARVPTVVSCAFYSRLDVCNLCKLLFQTQFLSKLIIEQ